MDKTRNDLLSRFITDAIEKSGQQFGGGGGGSEWDGFVTLDKVRGSTTNNNREAVTQWFNKEPEILEDYVSTLVDA